MMTSTITTYNTIIDKLKSLDFIVLLALRLYLAPIFIIAGFNKLMQFEDMVAWFGNPDWGLGLPVPAFMVSLTIIAELIGGFAILAGWLTRMFAFMLAITMLVAAKTVHWQNGWFAITPTEPTTSIASLFANLGFGSAHNSIQNSIEAGTRLDKARDLLQTHGNYDWLTETGNFVVLNNGVEFAVTYLIMLLVLVVYGAGKWLSFDFWLTPKRK